MSLLRFEKVALRRGGRLLFEDLNLDIDRGDALQVSGPNGSGKSSLIRLAAGLLLAERGRVERSSVALADDHLALDPELSLHNALRFWGGDTDGAMGVMGIDRLADVPVRLLSSGQSKRAMLARVIASGAALWLLDEPLNALDSQGAERLGNAISRHLAGGGAVVAASHQPLPGEWRSIELGA
nr:hypothetical protein [uncultured bacterium]